MNSEPPNAIAGPSNPRPLSTSAPHLFLPPPVPPQTRSKYLSSTQDLLARFNLLPAYDKYVRPSIAEESVLDQMGIPFASPMAGVLDKGKGKEVVGTPETPGIPDGGDGDDEEGAGGKGDKKKKNNYKHLIKEIPGKHSFRKDEYLFSMMQVPPKQRIQIQPFDARTQREAFAVSLEGLKGWNPNALVLESAQAREDRKKRKELKRLQKLQAQTQAQAVLPTSITHPQPIQASVPMTVATSSSTRAPPNSASTNASTPRPGSTPFGAPALATPAIQRPSSTVPKPGSTIHNSVTRPGSTIPRPGSAVPRKVASPLRPGLTGPGTPLRNPGTTTPSVPATNSHPMDLEKRGIKRERDEIGGAVVLSSVGAVSVNGNAAVNPTKAILNAKAGIAGVRPRPLKKQRVDIQGQTRDVTVMQQPTPQGV